MPTVEKTHGNRVLIRDVGHFVRGDQANVSDEMAAYLTEERGDFELADKVAENEDVETSVEEWHDWNEDDWLELDYEQRTDDVRKGRVDDHLAEIVDCETSSTVTDAVEARRDELED